MSDRKYRQRGYQDDSRDREPRREQKAPQAPRERPPGPRALNMPGFHEVLRCARCGNQMAASSVGPADVLARCPRCGTDLHACIQCAFFDTASRFECSEAIPARVTPKDARNECTFFAARTTMERETRSAGGPPDARKAFDDLFK